MRRAAARTARRALAMDTASTTPPCATPATATTFSRAFSCVASRDRDIIIASSSSSSPVSPPSFAAAWTHVRAYASKRTKPRAALTAEDMRTTRVVPVTNATQTLTPEDGTLYGAPPESWETRERAMMTAEAEAELDALLATYAETQVVEDSGLPSMEEILAGVEAEEAEERRARDAERKTEEHAFVRVPIRDSAGRSYGTGKRKTAVARVWLTPGRGEHKVNGKPYDEYFPSPSTRGEMVAPFFVSDTLGLFTATATVRGGGVSGQAQAVRHGISVALQNYDPVFRPALKAAGFLTRDPRVVERKKPGKAKARKSFAWVKR